ncbi:induced myeloid leukemia cell differentiation protein Mcl-1 isoform X2 [Colius striatus]|uniref:induced myeloid leukemia cell differentiation protein Mcl-1 isoform X2 n=1 Tax=Colius striatus TaxID=57412 RepID=UPI002B1E27B9|nr:induced myeloid leukemia cell differentiation protein Mcl-1 isoform X2 [Colius striatus]
MFAVRRNALIGFNLYCGGGSGPALAPASAAGGPAPPPPPPPAAAAEVPRAALGSAGPWAAAPAEGPRSLIGPAAAPRSLIGCGAAPHAARPGALWSPEEELDGCEPEPERGPAGGSLPGTPPELPDGLRQDSLELISRYLREAAGEAEPAVKKFFPGLLGGPGRPGGSGDAVMEKALETLRRVGNGVMQKHELAFQGMLRKLEIQKEEDLQSVCEVAAHLFSDGVTNWGRVVTLISFGAFVAKHLKSIKQEKCISSLAGIITDALVSSKREWLLSQGGWEGFVDFFRVEDLEGSIRNVLMAFAGVAGLGASLAYMIRDRRDSVSLEGNKACSGHPKGWRDNSRQTCVF